jgi:hypothetical protein
MVDILKSDSTFPLFSCLEIFCMVQESNCSMKACFRCPWMMISVGCNTLKQLACINKIKM